MVHAPAQVCIQIHTASLWEGVSTGFGWDATAYILKKSFELWSFPLRLRPVALIQKMPGMPVISPQIP